MAPRPHGAPGLLFGGDGRRAVCAAECLLDLFARSWGEHLGGWVWFLAFLSGVLFSVLLFRWLRRRILWRLRNRLIVTYVFIGVIPAVLLVTMAFVTLYGLAGQFAVFLVTSEIHSQLRSLEAANAAVSNELAARLQRGDSPAAESLAGLTEARSILGPATGLRLVRRKAPAPLQRIQGRRSWHAPYS